jgi:hypothetical protein
MNALPLEDNLKIITIIVFLGVLYYMYCRTYIKLLKPKKQKMPKPKKKKHPFKYLRRIHLPYKGQAKIYKFDKQYGYINSAWDEIQKPRKSKQQNNNINQAKTNTRR